MAGQPGILYSIPRSSGVTPALSFSKPPLVAFEHASSSESSHGVNNGPNSLVFLGGLFDGLGTVPYVQPLASHLPSTWSLVEPILGSSYRQWGISSLDEDVQEIEVIVSFLRNIKPEGRVVLIGHSTGSQMVMHYLLSPQSPSRPRPRIDGGIMQGCVSDREAITIDGKPSDIDAVNVEAASRMKNSSHGLDILPLHLTQPVFGSVPISAKRWLSLASPGPQHEGEDDYFSSDFGDERLDRTFGQLGKMFTPARPKVSWLFGAADQYVPKTVDRERMVRRWQQSAERGGAMVDEGSGIVQGASHTLKEGGKSMEDVIARVVGFLNRL